MGTDSPIAAIRSHPSRSFPTPDTALAHVIGDPGARSSFHKRLAVSNRFVVFFYRIGLLPLLGAGKSTMLLVTRGRKTHKIRRFPVGYLRIAGGIYLISGWGKESNGYKNIQTDPHGLQLQVGLRIFPATARVISEPSEIRRLIEQLITESPRVASRLLGWDPKVDEFGSSDFSPLINGTIFVPFVPARASASVDAGR